MKAFRTTKALCRKCHQLHPAQVVERTGHVLGITHCPEGDQEVTLSTNPELYERITQQSAVQADDPAPAGLKFLLNYVSITSACNFTCTVCATNAGGEGRHTFLSADEICRRSQAVCDQGATILHLFGGEPTLHPSLKEIIRRLTEMGLSVGLVSNGFLLGRKPELAVELKECGLKRVCLQFDSFKDDALHFLGRNYLNEKRDAIRNVIDAGLRIGLNCTVTKRNLPELRALLQQGLDLGVQVRNMTFGTAAPVGRFNISESDSVDREQVIMGLIGDERDRVFSVDDVRPLPAYLPWGLQVHPDCGVHIVLVRSPRGARPLNRYIDMARLGRLFGKSTRNGSVTASKILPMVYALTCIRPARLPELIALALGMAVWPARFAVMNIGISDYRAAQFLDQERICRCASAFHTSTGPIGGCLHFYQRIDVPGSQAYEAAHASC